VITNLVNKNDKILEIGPGNGTVTDYLRKRGPNVTTLDIDPDLNPDCIGDITELTKIFEPDSFDLILCAEVLEHIPFDDVETALKNIYEVTSCYAIVSIPHFSISVSLALKIPLFEIKHWFVRIPFPIQHKFDGEHYWEIGKKGYSVKNIKRLLNKIGFTIVKEETPILNTYHHFFVLKK